MIPYHLKTRLMTFSFYNEIFFMLNEEFHFSFLPIFCQFMLIFEREPREPKEKGYNYSDFPCNFSTNLVIFVKILY